NVAPPSLSPSGPFLSFDAGPLQGRFYSDSGHLALAGPDLGGVALANVIVFAPPGVGYAGGVAYLGRVLSSTPLPNGLELTQELGARTVQARLTFAAEGVMRYEVVDWDGPPPDETLITAASPESERFYGFGEKFNALDQSGKKVQTLTFDQPGNKGDRSY